jgi:glycosyltransferase involved in cell wall biosynthesis
MKIIYIGNQMHKQSRTPTTIDTLSKQFEEEGIEVVKASPYANKILRLLHMTWIIIKNAKSSQLVLIDTYSSSAFVFCVNAVFWSKCFGIPYCPILHGGNLKSRLSHSPKLSKFVFGGASVNIGVSGFFEEVFKANNFPFTIIPNNIDINVYEYRQRSKMKPTILWVRSFARFYQPNLALDILKLLLIDYPGAQLTMIGPDKDGSMQEFNEYAKELNLDQHVHVLGLKTKHEWREISKSHDIFLSTTTIDNTPVSVIEAMALGLPVVSTRVGGVPFIIQDEKDGLMYESGNAQDAVNKIKKCLNDADFTANLSQTARMKAENWGWPQVKIQWKELFDKFSKKTK